MPTPSDSKEEDIVQTVRNNRVLRCRLILSWRWRSFQGFGCSPIKKIRELGSDRRETGQSLSTAGVLNLEGSSH